MRNQSITAIVMAAALAACGGEGGGSGSPTAPSQPRTLTSAEATAVARALVSPSVNVAQRGNTPSGSSAPSYETSVGNGEIPFNFTVPCKPTGSANLNGRLSAVWSNEQVAFLVQAFVAVRHQACPVQTDHGVVTVTGDPNVELSLTAAVNATGIVALLGTEKGTIRWTTADGASGQCHADVQALAIAGTPNYHVWGTVCGKSVDHTGAL